MHFGNLLKELRTKRGLSQRELGERLGITQQTVAQYERSKTPPKPATITSIALSLDFPPDELIALAYIDPANGTKDFVCAVSDAIRVQKEAELCEFFDLLNNAGRDKAIELLELITHIPEYKKGYINPSAPMSPSNVIETITDKVQGSPASSPAAGSDEPPTPSEE